MIRKLTKADDRSGFTCGVAELDLYFREKAWQHQRRHVSMTYVAADTDQVLGYVTVCPGTVIRTDSEVHLRHMPPFALPILLVARLAVSVDARGGRNGAHLLRYAVGLAPDLAGMVGCVGVVVDAKANSASFYEKYGFEPIATMPFPPHPRLFLPLSAVPASKG
jgi:GNAT superfamily N-acetyltransferase